MTTKKKPPKWQTKDYSHLEGKTIVWHYNRSNTLNGRVALIDPDIGITIKADDGSFLLCLTMKPNVLSNLLFLRTIRCISKGVFTLQDHEIDSKIQGLNLVDICYEKPTEADCPFS